MSDPYVIVPPRGTPLPIVVSVPHSGTEIPPDVARPMYPEMVAAVPDTDWFVHELYSFAPAMGITLLHARYSRFVIDLNRDPDDKPLYADGRHQTGLVPHSTFDTRPIYLDKTPDAQEVQRRLEHFYRPYHAKVEELMLGLRARFPHVLLFEAHSIKRHVASIRAAAFPDLMIGDQQGKTADPRLSAAALAGLRDGGAFTVAHNAPFMGGFLTRKFGRPKDGVHALQLEMSQDVYMDEIESRRYPSKEAKMGAHLSKTLNALARTLGTLS